MGGPEDEVELGDIPDSWCAAIGANNAHGKVQIKIGLKMALPESTIKRLQLAVAALEGVGDAYQRHNRAPEPPFIQFQQHVSGHDQTAPQTILQAQ